MKSIGQLKDEALDALHGNFGKAALATLGLYAIVIGLNVIYKLMGGVSIVDYYKAQYMGDSSFLLDSIKGNAAVSIIQILVSILFLTPLTVGIINTFRLLFESKGAENNIFSNFFKLAFGKKYGHIVLVSFLSALLIGLLILPGTIVAILLIVLAHSVTALSWIFAIALIVYMFWLALMYSQINFIMLDNPELDTIDVMRRSRELMNGNKWRFLGLLLSFIGWILLCIVTLGIGALWLDPYIHTTRAAFYCEIRDAQKPAEA